MYRDGWFEGDDFIESSERDEDIIVEGLDGKMTQVRRVDEGINLVT